MNPGAVQQVIVDWKELTAIVALVVIAVNVLSSYFQIKWQSRLIAEQQEDFRVELKRKLDTERYERECSACQTAVAKSLESLKAQEDRTASAITEHIGKLGEITQFMRSQSQYGPKEMAEGFMVVLRATKVI